MLQLYIYIFLKKVIFNVFLVKIEKKNCILISLLRKKSLDNYINDTSKLLFSELSKKKKTS